MRGREKKGRPTRFKNRGEAGVGIAGFIKLEKPALVTPVLSFFKLMKPSLVTPVLGFKKKEKPALGTPVSITRTTLVIFSISDVDLGIFIFIILLPYKTQFYYHSTLFYLSLVLAWSQFSCSICPCRYI